MSEIRTWREFIHESAVPLAYAALAGAVAAPLLGIGIRGLFLTERFALKYRSGEGSIGLELLRKLGLLRWGGNFSSYPVRTGRLHELAREIFTMGRDHSRRYEYLDDFFRRANDWAWQCNPYVAWTGALIGYNTPRIFEGKMFLNEEKYDWPTHRLLQFSSALVGALTAFVTHNVGMNVGRTFFHRGGFYLNYVGTIAAVALAVMAVGGFKIAHPKPASRIARGPVPQGRIDSWQEFMRESSFPIHYTQLTGVLAGPLTGILFREIGIRTSLPKRLSQTRVGFPFNLARAVGLFRAGTRTGGYPLSIGELQRQFKATAGTVRNRAEFKLNSPVLRGPINDWATQTTPFVILAGIAWGYLIPWLFRDNLYLQEDKFDWSADQMLKITTALFGGLAAYVTHEMGRQWGTKFMFRRLGFYGNYFGLPLAWDALFVAAQFLGVHPGTANPF